MNNKVEVNMGTSLLTVDFFNLRDQITVNEEQVNSRLLLENSEIYVQLFAMGANESISTEVAATSRWIYVLEGELQMTLTGNEPIIASSGVVCALPEGVGYGLIAHTGCKFVVAANQKGGEIS